VGDRCRYFKGMLEVARVPGTHDYDVASTRAHRRRHAPRDVAEFLVPLTAQKEHVLAGELGKARPKRFLSARSGQQQA
jgi:hypothetical protein